MNDITREELYASYASQIGEKSSSTESVLLSRIHFFENALKVHIPREPSAKIVELGCGSGAFLLYLKNLGYRDVVGVDCSGEQVQAAKAAGLNVDLGDALTALNSRPAASLDAVVAVDVLEHMNRTEAIALVKRAHSVLKPEGVLILHVPNAGSPMFGRVRYGDITHETAFTVGSMNQLLRMSGFSIIECFEDRPIAHGLPSAVRAFLWKLVRVFWTTLLVIESGVPRDRIVWSQNFLAVARVKE